MENFSRKNCIIITLLLKLNCLIGFSTQIPLLWNFAFWGDFFFSSTLESYSCLLKAWGFKARSDSSIWIFFSTHHCYIIQEIIRPSVPQQWSRQKPQSISQTTSHFPSRLPLQIHTMMCKSAATCWWPFTISAFFVTLYLCQDLLKQTKSKKTKRRSSVETTGW